MILINIGIAVMPNRIENLKIILPILLEQCDNLYIHVNGDAVCPDFIKNNKKIKYSSSTDNKGGEMAFIGVDQTEGYYLVVDDDLLYPKDYVEKMISLMNKFDNKIIATVHGSNFTPGEPNFIKKRQMFKSYKSLDKDTKVMIVGVGTLCINTKNFKITPKDFPYHNMRDAVVSCKAAKEGVPIIALKRDEHWITKLNNYGASINRDKDWYLNFHKLFEKHQKYFNNF